MISLATPTAPAQIIYVSDNRSVSVAVGLDTNNAFFSLGGLASVSYSGDASGSVSPYTPYADFNSGINGNVNISSAYNGATNSYFATANANQASTLGSQGIIYSSSVSQNNDIPQVNVYTHCSESSFFQVSFMVATATPYDLVLSRGNDTSFGPGTWTLTSANLGTLVGPPSDLSSTGPFSFSGTFTPGDVYTLTLQQTGGVPQSSGELETFQATLSVPEPKSILLLAMGMFCLFAARHRRKSTQQFRLVPVPAHCRKG